MGDFNCLLYYKDIIGGNPVGNEEIKNFRDCVDSCGLEEMPMEGAYYTWSNRQMQGKRIYSRIDRTLCKIDWMLKHEPKVVVK
ncbi:hypothetical protein DM860_017585 [Cuscuta australis]|uniref:Endonuclease/exonuclease/phosphatase domain-containing protein n=1 Tax=Cuscuta australis TaxID=267555 RepID=A0A328D9J4_9ASTE|nr:hypothetical protein DM860_017585 [Cuscuta australis]